MESLGNKLKTVREDKGLSLENVGNETNISTRYLNALENEDYSVFPSEPYAIGFLKSYSDYLELNEEEVMSLYRSQKIQDQPVPMEELLRGPSKLPKVLAIIAIVLAVIGLGIGIFFFISNLPVNEAPPPQPERIPTEYIMTGDFLERRLYPGDSVMVSGETDIYRLVFLSIGDALSLSTPRGSIILDLGQEVTVDIGDSGYARLRIAASDFVRNDSSQGALLRFEQELLPQIIIPVTEDLPMEITAIREGTMVIYSSPSPMPFTLQANFQNYCFFRYEILFEQDRQGRNEQYFQRSQEISITAQNGIRMGISNAQAVRLQAIIGGRVFPFEAGGAGEVIAADLRWLRDENNIFSLVLILLQ